MMAPDLHTPLESLLLFQTLYPFDAPDAPSFSRVSESLKSNELLQESASSTRLEPDSLKDLYLRLLKEEVRAEAGQNAQQEGGQSPRKRKRSSPVLETIEEARQYTHLMPQLVNRLYFRYRDHAIKSIEDEERKYRSFQREMQEIERGERDSRLQQQEATALRRDSRGISSIQNILRHDDETERPQSGVRSRPTSSHELPNGSDSGLQKGVPLEPMPNGYAQSSDQKYPQQPGSADSSAPFLPPPQNINHGYSAGSPNPDIHRRLPPPHPSQPYTAPLPSPRSTHNQLPPSEQSSASPIILPPPKGMRISSGSPTGPLDALADMAGQQYRASPSMPTPSQFQPPAQQQPHTQHQPSPSHMQRPHQYYDNQPPYQAPYSPYGQGPLPAYGQQHPGMPAYQGAAASPSHNTAYGNGPHYQSPMPTYSQQQGYGHNPGYYQQSAIQTPYARGQVQRFADCHTPMSSASGRQRPPKPSPIFTSASSTRWKNVDTPGSVRQYSPVRPGSRDISPVSDKAPSPSPEPPKTRTRGNRGQQSQLGVTDPLGGEAKAKFTPGRQPRRGRGGRAGSIGSSTVAESTQGRSRSQSITSQADELSMDIPTASTCRIKPEPSIASAHEDDASITSRTADESSRKPGRQRRGTLRGVESSDTPRSNIKRKREGPSMLPPPSPSPAPTPVPRPGYVLGARSFPRTSATLMNEIIAHKVANVFAKPLSERDAPGYKDLIYRSQDLKSIKTAINAGSKALVTAAEAAGEDASSSSVWIPESPDILPPKGIVNSAQLEKELMRMFANAIMYNLDLPSHRGVGPAFRTRARTARGGTTDLDDEAADDDEEVAEKGKEDVSVVKDTREMFSAVAPTISRWRSAEKAAENDGKGSGATGRLRGGSGADEEVDELAGEEVVGSVEREVEQETTPEPRAKRRRR